MCLAVPARVVALENQMATVEVDGVQRQVSALMVPELKLGDYVIAHAGFAMHVVDEKDAQESLALLRELAAGMGPTEG
jgi:hydrogenase expression/formation protein HypC